MQEEIIASTTYEVCVSIDALERHLDSDFLQKILSQLHVNTLSLCHLRADLVSSSLSFFVIKESK